MNTLTDWLGSGAVAVSSDLSQSRANVCACCPMNKQGHYALRATMAGLRSIIEIKNRMKLRVKGEKKLGVCAGCGCDLRTKVHVPISHIRNNLVAGETEKFDPQCWIRNET